MGIVWSDYRKVKNNTMLLTKAVISADIKDDVWLLWKALKDTPDFDELKADGFGLGKDEFDGGRWKILWWYKIQKNSFDEVKGVPRWRRERDQLIQKWILKLAAIKDALADENSDDSDNSFERSQDVSNSDDSEDQPKPVKKSSAVKPKVDSADTEDEPKPVKKSSAVKPKVIKKEQPVKKSSAVKPKVVKQESVESDESDEPVKPKAVKKSVEVKKTKK